MSTSPTNPTNPIQLRAQLLDSVRSSGLAMKGVGVADVLLGASGGDQDRARVTALEIVYRDTDRLHALRWPPVVDALLLGATLEDVSEAMAEAPEWIAEKLIDWADHEEIGGRMSEEQGDALRELLHAAGGPAPTQPHPIPILSDEMIEMLDRASGVRIEWGISCPHGY